MSETDPDDPDSTDPDGTDPDGTDPSSTDPKPYRGGIVKLPKLEQIDLFDTTTPPADPEVFLTQSKGDQAFCKENPSHESCQEKETDDCEAVGAVVLSGTEAIGGGISRCDLLKTLYWRET